MTARIGVVTFPGSLDDRDAQRAIRIAGAEPVALWHRDTDLHGVDAVVLPGGFSFGDYLRAGTLATYSSIMAEVVTAAGKGLPVLGICNGFQMLTESHLLPGALTRNAQQHFIRRDQPVIVERDDTAWTNQLTKGEEIIIPIKNADGRFVATDAELDRLEGEGLVTFRYPNDKNPNGSARNIAGITNAHGNVVGLMPHPEHAILPGFGPDTPAAMRSGTDGLRVFASVIETLVAAV